MPVRCVLGIPSLFTTAYHAPKRNVSAQIVFVQSKNLGGNMDTTTMHSWTQDFHEPGGEWYGVKTCLQHHRCRRCGVKGVRPDDGSLPEETGCTGTVMQKIVRPDPFEGRNDDEVSEKNSKDFQRHTKGKRN